MKKIKVPIIPLGKEDQIQEEIYKASAEESEEPNSFAFDDENDIPEGIRLILLGIEMEKYIHLFAKSKITMKTFLKLDESDLRALGITDTKDVEIIIKNLEKCNKQNKKRNQPVKKTLLEINNIVHDIQIARNIKNELVLLQNYCRYLELQMGRHKLIDYRINWKESASTYLEAFTETALLQARIINHRMFQDSEDNLIVKTLKLNNGTLPKELKEILQKKKPKRRLKTFSVVVIGILSLAVLIKKVVIKN